MAAYFSSAEPSDAAWAMWFLTGHKPRQAVPTKRLHLWAAEAAGIPLWLFEESYDAVGDLAETIALVLPPTQSAEADPPLHAWVEERILPLRDLPKRSRRRASPRTGRSSRSRSDSSSTSSSPAPSASASPGSSSCAPWRP
jgi:DNA ligase-1